MEPFIVNTDITEIDYLYGRDKSIKILKSCASRKENAGIIGARRFGKTPSRESEAESALHREPHPSCQGRDARQPVEQGDPSACRR